MGTAGFAAFAALLATHFGWDGPLTEGTRLVEDPGVDSLEMLEIVAALGELAGHEVPEEAVAVAATLGDLWEMACRYAHHRPT
jgi:acyl carrier protein